VARGPRVLPGVPGPLRERGRRQRRARPGLGLSRPAHPSRAWEDRPSDGAAGSVEFFVGDLAGLEARLDHLVDLGVNAIYLNPVFDSRSNHGYDTIDYGHVAAHFGGRRGPRVPAARDARTRHRVILDIAPNHTGAEHPWFLAAQADPSAKTAGFYTFRSRPDDYESWLGVKSLPKLDYRDAGLRQAMYAGDGAILRRWLEPPFSADGWRIDVANMLGRQGPVQLGPEVARGMRAAVKDANPDAYLMGEHFYDATDALNGDQWDGVMNYAGFTNPVLEWLSVVEHRSAGFGTVVAAGARSTDEMVASLDAFRAAIPWAVARCQYDLLGSHDTPRVRSVGRRPGSPAGGVRAAVRLRRGARVPVRRRGRAPGRRGQREPPRDAVERGGLGPRPPRVHPRSRQVARPVPRPPGRRLPGPRDRHRFARLPARHGRRAGDRRRRARPGAAYGGPCGVDRGDRGWHCVHLALHR